MTTAAQLIIFEAQNQLQDFAGIRWSAIELVRHLNDGQRDIVTLRPDMAAITAAMVLVAGAKQTVPATCAKLIDIPRNTAGQAIRLADRRMLDVLDPNWYSNAGVTVIKHFSAEPSEPRAFYVYPPAAAAGASVDLVQALFPTDVPAATGASYTAVTGNIGVADAFKNALLHFCLFRAFSKDAEFGGNTELSGAHFSLFKDLTESAH